MVNFAGRLERALDIRDVRAELNRLGLGALTELRQALNRFHRHDQEIRRYPCIGLIMKEIAKLIEEMTDAKTRLGTAGRLWEDEDFEVIVVWDAGSGSSPGHHESANHAESVHSISGQIPMELDPLADEVRDLRLGFVDQRDELAKLRSMCTKQIHALKDALRDLRASGAEREENLWSELAVVRVELQKLRAANASMGLGVYQPQPEAPSGLCGNGNVDLVFVDGSADPELIDDGNVG